MSRWRHAGGASGDRGLAPVLAHLDGEDYCYLTTTGRVSGTPHTVEIWFGVAGDTIYLIAGGRDRSDWVRNLATDPHATVRILQQEFPATARLAVADADERALAARLLHRKYSSQVGSTVQEWAETAYVVALDVAGLAAPEA